MPTTISCASRSATTLPNACSSVPTPFTGESALATATIRPGSLAARGWNRRVSTPSGMTRTFASGTRKSRQMSSREDWDAVRIVPQRRATRACIRTKEYQRRLASRDRDNWGSPLAAASSIRRSTLIGWWMLVTSGKPALASPSSPYPRTWLSCTRSKSARRARSTRSTRRLNVSGSGNDPTRIEANSSTSIQSRNSDGRGQRNGSGSRYRSRLGTVRRAGPGSSSG